MKLSKLYLLILLLTGCQTVVELNGDGLQRKVVLNSVLEVGSDTTRVQISLTQPVGDMTDWAQIQTAEVRLFENEVLLGNALPEKPGWYVFVHPIKPATVYRIEAEVSGFDNVWGETSTPGPLQATNIDIQFEPKGRSYYTANISWTDNRAEQNYYWIGASYSKVDLNLDVDDTTKLYMTDLLYSNNSLIDPFNRISDEVDGITTCYEYYIRAEDSGLDGQPLCLSFRALNSSDKFVTYILSVDRHYDAYLKSSIQNKENTDLIEDLPLFYRPAYTHSNIHGGVGLVGSFTRIEKSLILTYEERYPGVGSFGGAID